MTIYVECFSATCMWSISSVRFIITWSNFLCQLNAELKNKIVIQVSSTALGNIYLMQINFRCKQWGSLSEWILAIGNYEKIPQTFELRVTLGTCYNVRDDFCSQREENIKINLRNETLLLNTFDSSKMNL